MMPERIAIVGILILASFSIVCASSKPNYHEALLKSIIFFEGQRSGKLPPNQTITWRSHSGLSDGSAENVDLTGGYYDAGDNVKFGFPMAFSTTMIAWSILEYGKRMPSEINHARAALRWGTDYLLKASSKLPNALYVQVGDPATDHKCWERPEDMDTPRPVYKVTPANPGSEVAAETAAALAAASIAFKHVDPNYSKQLLATAKKAFEFADDFHGNYNDSLASVVCPYYCSYNGYRDELLWGAAWLYKATKEPKYFTYVQEHKLEDNWDTFSWDSKLPGVNVLLSRLKHVKNEKDLERFQGGAEKFMCSVLPDSPSLSVEYTPGGLMYKNQASNLQYVTAASFLLTTYAKHLKFFDTKTFNCEDMVVSPAILRKHARKQVDYILGVNPNKMSYMVGFGNKFPQSIHHRGSSLLSIAKNSQPIACNNFDGLNSANPNPNILTGAVVGGPDHRDAYIDDRNNFAQGEPTTYINAALIGPLASFVDKPES